MRMTFCIPQFISLNDRLAAARHQEQLLVSRKENWIIQSPLYELNIHGGITSSVFPECAYESTKATLKIKMRRS